MSAILDALRKAGDRYRRKYKELLGSGEEDSKQKESDRHLHKNQKHSKKKSFTAKIILTATTIFSLILIIVCIFGIYIIFKSFNRVEILDKKYESNEMQLTPSPKNLPSVISTPDISNEQKEELKKIETPIPTETPEPSKPKVRYKVTLEDLAKINITPSPQPTEPPILIDNKATEDSEKSESKIQIKKALPQTKTTPALPPQDKKQPIETSQTPKTINIDDSSIEKEEEKGIGIKNETLPTPQVQTESATEETQNPQKNEAQTTKENKTPQTESSPKVEVLNSSNKFNLEGIAWNDKGALAIINGAMVKVGDIIDGGKVTKIDKNSVEIEIDGKPLIITH